MRPAPLSASLIVFTLFVARLVAQPAPPSQTYVADIGAAPFKAPVTADFAPGATYTMEGWFYLTARTPFAWFMGKGPATTGNPLGFGLFLDPNGSQLTFFTSTGVTDSVRIISTPADFPLMAWTHVAAVMDNGVTRLLINGTVVATGNASGPPPNAPTVPFGVGVAYAENGDPNFQSFSGYARQVRFWNVARTAAQISAAISESLPSDRTGLVAAWPLDESSGTTARDLSGAGRALSTGGIVPMQSSVLAAGPFFASGTPTPVANGPLGLIINSVLMDFDSDGDKDLIVLDTTTSVSAPATPVRLRAYRNNAGTFADVTDAVLGNVTMFNPRHAIVADFNGDGLPDLFVAGHGWDHFPWPGEQSRILIRNASGQLVDETATRLPQHSCFTHNIAVADIDGDGDLDIYMGNIGGGDPNIGPRFYMNDGTGHFTEATDRIPADISNRGPGKVYTSCLLVDVNGDGHPDLVLGGDTSNELLMNDGTGHFVRDPRFVMPPRLFTGGAVTVAIATADFNGDGKPDLLLSTTGGTHLMGDGTTTTGYAAAGLQLLLNRGDGTFTDATPTAGFSWSANEYWVVWPRIVDLNGDGYPDIVAEVGMAPPQTASARIFLNRGNGQFVDATAAYRVPNDTGYVDVADLDGDGRMDLLTVTPTAITTVRNIQPLNVDVFSPGNQPPAFTTPPDPRVVTVGGSCTFMVAVSGYPKPAFQWQKDGVAIAGATGGTYTISSIKAQDAGSYTVVATNSMGAATSAGATLVVKSPPAQNYVNAAGLAPLKAPATADFAPGSTFTLEAWIHLSEVATGYPFLMGKPLDANADPYLSFNLQLVPGNWIAFAITDGQPGHLGYFSSHAAIPVGAWTHVAVTVNGGTFSLYINGALDSSQTYLWGPPKAEPAVPFSIGKDYHSNGDSFQNPFPGAVSNARFWNVARTADQIASAMTESLPSDTTGLVADWPLDESSGTTARDISGHGFALTAASAAISSVRTAIVDAQPFFASTVTNITDGSLQYVNPTGTLIDVDKDGKMEVIEVQGGPATFPETRTRVRVYRLQNGAYVDATDSIFGTVTLVAPSRAIVADFNGDGWDDLLLVGIGTDAPPFPGEQSKLLLNDKAGHLVEMTASNLPQYAAYTHDATVGDIDGDGDIDIVMGNLNVGAVGPRVYVNDGTGKFTVATGRLPTDIENQNATTSYTAWRLVDISGDGRPDLVLGGWPGGAGTNNEILLNNGSGTFTRAGAPVLPAKLYGMGGTVVGIIKADFNGDGRIDLLLSTTDHYLHASLQLLLRQADGSFADAIAQMGITWDPSVAEIDRSTSVIDLNNDGSPDIVAHFYSAADFSFHTRLFLNRGDATFIEATSVLPSGPIGSSFHAADVDGDGLADLVSTAAPWVNFLRALKPISLSYFYDAPAITTQPVTRVAVVGASTTFSVSASGYPTPTFQWQKNGVNISGATGGSYTIASPTLADAGAYTVVVTNAAGTVTSSTASLYVVTAAGAPYFTAQPSDQTVSVGATATFTVAAGGTPVLTYQWQKGGTAINGATNATLTLASVTAADAGSYVCIATNASGSATSSMATLTVNKVTPTITWSAPAAITYGTALSAVQLNATASVPGAFAYNPATGAIPGAGSQTLSVTFTPTDTVNYTTATATQTLTVTKAVPTITWSAPAPVTYGTALSAVQLSATANAPGTFVYSPASGVVPGAGGQTLGVTFTPTDTVNYTTATGAQTLTVNKAALTARADDKGKVQGTANPALTITYSGFVNGETKTVITEPTISTTATTDSAAGTYPITLTGGSAANYTLTLVNGTLTITSGSYLANLSVRAAMAAGQTLIVGFVVDGGAKPILVRAAGPVLNKYGLTGVVDPQLKLFTGGGTQVAGNDNWDAALASTFTILGAFPFDPGSKDAALQQTINGPHSAQATATGAGAILVEAYDVGPNDGRKLVNLSTRFQVGTGDNILIAGFVLSGTGTRQLLIRAVGPTLTNYGVTGVLADPQLSVFDGGTAAASNNDWSSTLSATFTTLGAFALNAASKDAAIVVTLQAGKPYSVQVSGVGGTTGEALVEIYLVP
jgi:hypothetical protein